MAFVYTSNVTRSLRPETFVEAYRASRQGLTLNLSDPTLWPRYFHMLFGAVAVAGLAVALFGVFRREHEPEMASWAMRKGTVMFGVSTAINIFVGMWFLLAQPKEILIRLVGGETWAMTLLALGILLGIASGGFALLALGAKDAARATKAQIGILLPTLIVMVLLRDQLRQLVLRDAGFEHPSWVEPQWGPMAVFAVLLVAAVGTIAWMARALARGGAGRGGTAALLAVALLAGRGHGRAGRGTGRSPGGRPRWPKPAWPRGSWPLTSRGCCRRSSPRRASKGPSPSARRWPSRGRPTTGRPSRTTSAA